MEKKIDRERLMANLFKARFPFLYISTWEEERALSLIQSIASNQELIKTQRKVLTWKLTTGFEGEETGKSGTRSAIKALEMIESYQSPAIFVLQDFHIFFGDERRQPDHQVTRKLRDISFKLKRSPIPKNVVFLSPVLLLPHDLEKDITIFDFNLPTFNEIKQILEEMIAVNKQSGRIEISLNEEEKEKLVNAALGLTLSEAENAFARAMVDDGKLSIDDVDVVLGEKEQIIKKTEILEFVNNRLNMEDVGGLENLKRWLRKRNKSWLESAQKYGLPAPKGVLITGVPGCGKSLISKAISEMWQLPLLRLDIGKIFSGLVGSSEENMRKAVQTAEAIAPSILWIDEIEKGFSGVNSSGDGGTTSRIFGHFLTWMQEKEKPVFVIATANNISSLPTELLRKGRFDEIFFVDLPTHRERIEIFRVHLEKRLKDPAIYGDFHINQDTLNRLASLTEGFVGAEIEQVVINGLFEAFYEDRSVTLHDFEKICKQFIPLSVTQAEHIKSIRDWANVRAVAATPFEDRSEYSESVETADSDISTSRGGRTIDF
ncbi:AAA family ATPase [Bacillus sp. FJAT-49711]|uniref:AAA family ATPase n=1 Tax=Bacillus sp. FJAT-49711 TaxID=2833585 RepID=UPI001BC9B6F3|nr:AAA family ATPase [Bacillus sp. FJAT-49711]MBS4218453.1 AAA family ATPase [Bacillus sp. FJAT-49711]